jgi:hypothetical protein
MKTDFSLLEPEWTAEEELQLMNALISQGMVHRGAQYLTGENLEVVWAEFSTLS